jgi:hypothetical protein
MTNGRRPRLTLAWGLDCLGPSYALASSKSFRGTAQRRAPLEIRHRSVRPISAKHAQASRFLQQSPEAASRKPSECAAMGRNFMFVSESTMPTRMNIDTTVTLNFRCLTDNDPQYTRPNIENTPNVIIENRNR